MRNLKAGVGLLTGFMLLAFWLPAEHIFDVPHHYLALHTVLEFSAMAMAVMVFALTWTLHRRSDQRMLALGLGFLLVATVDFAHTFSFAGMPAFVTPSGPEKAINFWLAARLFSAAALLLFAYLPQRPASRPATVLGLLGAVALVGLSYWGGLWHGERLPRTFIPSEGLTNFKIGAEYALVALFLAAAFRLVRQTRDSASFSTALMAAAAWTMGLSELFFTLYGQVTDIMNLSGHVYKTVAYGMIFYAIFVQGVRMPQSALQEMSARYRNIIAATNVGTWEWNIKSGAVVFNERWCTMLGYSPGEIRPDISSWSELVHPDDWQTIRAELDPHLTGRTPFYECEHRLRHKAGHYVWILDCGQVVERAGNGSALRAAGVHMDITDRKAMQQRTEELLARLQKISAKVPGMVFQFQRWPDGRAAFPYASEGMREIFGLAPEAVAQDAAPVFQVLHPDDMERVRAAIRVSASRMRTWHDEFRAVLPDARTLWLECEAEPETVADGSVLWHGYVRDVTDRKRMGEELARYRHHLEELVETRTAELAAAKVAAEAANVAKSAFLAHMSHEIRTPLNAILGMAQIALRDPKAASGQDYLRQIHDSGRLLLELVNDILDLAKIEAGKLSLEQRPVDLLHLVQRAMRLTAPRALTQRLEFSADCAPDLPRGILCDETRLLQVLVNLLGNAIKFTDQGSVKLRVSKYAEGERCWLEMAVEDTGIGMSAAQVQQLFRPFTQADSSTTRRFGGTGLGLSITKHIVELMQGGIEVRSEPGRGTCFLVRLPVIEARLPEGVPALPAAQPGQRLRGLHVLAAEDDGVNRWVLQDLLEQEGARCTVASNGLEALELLHQGAADVDVLITDVQMPGLNGYDTTRRCRALYPRLPVIGLTAYALAEERQHCLEAGMFDHVTKPVDVDELCTVILRAVGRPRAPDAQVPPSRAPESAGAGGAVEPAIDWPALWARLRRPDAVQQILRTLVEHHGGSAALLRELLARGDGEEIAWLAHRLRGVGSTVFAPRLCQAAGAVEAQLRGAEAAAAVAVAGLADEVEALLEAARAGLADLKCTRA
ncbi:MASE3 domain-containing protein [uncultured Azohydromonas sp.]|uniref:MASE3 domain-containing protein n=1 Tax=uncultured Azohydromonas sp. TaxID=487342 RepID=UPI0026146B1C|nr:MASE3 domain-containing protein [uncultured Azohydromonas sp.]